MNMRLARQLSEISARQSQRGRHEHLLIETSKIGKGCRTYLVPIIVTITIIGNNIFYLFCKGGSSRYETTIDWKVNQGLAKRRIFLFECLRLWLGAEKADLRPRLGTYLLVGYKICI